MTATMLPDWRVRATGPRWPLQPLLDAAGMGATELAQTAGFSRRSGHRWAAAGDLDDHLADLLATRVGLHPVLVWPDW